MKDLLRFLKYILPYKRDLIGASVFLMLSGLLAMVTIAFVKPLYNEVLGAKPAVQQTSKQVMAPSPAVDPQKVSPSGEGTSVEKPKILVDKKDIMQFLERRLLMEKLRKYTKNRMFIEVPLFLFIVFLIKAVMGYFGQYLILNAGLKTIMDLRADLYGSIQDQSLKFFAMNPTGLIMSRIMSDVERLHKIVSVHLADAIRIVFTLIFVTIFVFYVSWQLSIICFVALPLAFYFIVRFGKKSKKASRKSQERMAEVASLLNETIGGAKVVKSFSMEAFEKSRFRAALKKMFRADKKIAKISALAPNVMELIGALIGMFILWWAGHSISKGMLRAGDLLTFILGAAYIFISVKKLNIINNEFQIAAAAASRVFEMMDSKSEVKELDNAADIPAFQRDISFRNVSFSYGEEDVLKNIDLTIRKGQVIALVGSSGAGKTTLANLVPRFYDVTAGSIFIDDHDIRDVKVKSLRDQISVVSQETILFNDTVRNNIAYGRPETDPEEIIKVAKAAQAHDFIVALPQQYDTVLGERGERLSAGQRQRISIARALLKNSPILILDEATSALDTASEAQVQEALNILMQGRTSIVIAHRLSTVRRADRIYVLDSCGIVEQGTHRELLDMNGVYAKLHAIQFRED